MASNKIARRKAWEKWWREQRDKRPERFNPKTAFMTGWNRRHEVEQKKAKSNAP